MRHKAIPKKEASPNLRISGRSKAIKKSAKQATPKKETKMAQQPKQFQFFYSRTCFRGFVEFYKQQLENLKSQIGGPKEILKNVSLKKTLEPRLRDLFCKMGLSDVFKDTRIASKKEQSLFIVTMLQVLYCHRYNADDQFVKDMGQQIQELYEENE